MFVYLGFFPIVPFNPSHYSIFVCWHIIWLKWPGWVWLWPIYWTSCSLAIPWASPSCAAIHQLYKHKSYIHVYASLLHSFWWTGTQMAVVIVAQKWTFIGPNLLNIGYIIGSEEWTFFLPSIYYLTLTKGMVNIEGWIMVTLQNQTTQLGHQTVA